MRKRLNRRGFFDVVGMGLAALCGGLLPWRKVATPRKAVPGKEPGTLSTCGRVLETGPSAVVATYVFDSSGRLLSVERPDRVDMSYCSKAKAAGTRSPLDHWVKRAEPEDFRSPPGPDGSDRCAPGA